MVSPSRAVAFPQTNKSTTWQRPFSYGLTVAHAGHTQLNAVGYWSRVQPAFYAVALVQVQLADPNIFIREVNQKVMMLCLLVDRFSPLSWDHKTQAIYLAFHYLIYSHRNQILDNGIFQHFISVLVNQIINSSTFFSFEN